MYKKIGRLRILLLAFLLIVLLIGLVLSRSSFVSDQIVSLAQSALRQNIPPDFSIRIKGGSVSLVHRAVFLHDIELTIPESTGVRGTVAISRLRLKLNPFRFFEDDFYIREASLLKPRIDLTVLEKERDATLPWDTERVDRLLTSLLPEPPTREEMPLYLPDGLILHALRVKDGTLAVGDENGEWSGQFDTIDLSLRWKGRAHRWQGRVSGLQGHFQRHGLVQEIDGLRTTFHLGPREIGLQEGVAQGAEFHVSAKGRFVAEEPSRLNLEIEGRGPLEHLSRFSGDLPSMKGRADLRVEIRGAATDPHLLANIRIPEGEIRQVPFRQLSLDGEMDRQRITVRTLSAQTLQGRLQAQGAWAFSEGEEAGKLGKYSLNAAVDGVELGALLRLFVDPKKLPLAGRLKAEVHLRGTGLRLNNLEGDGVVEMDPLRIEVERVPGRDPSGSRELSLKTSIAYALDGPAVTVKMASAQGVGLALKSRGTFRLATGHGQEESATPREEKGFHDDSARFAVRELALEIESRLLPEKYKDLLPFPLAGVISFHGKLAGALDRPSVDGQIEAQDLVIKKYPKISHVKTNFSWNEDSLRLQQATVRAKEAWLHLGGEILFPRKASSLAASDSSPDGLTIRNLHVDLKEFRAEDLKEWVAIDVPLSGAAAVTGILHRRDGRWSGKAQLSLERGNLWQQRFESLRAAVELASDRLGVRDFVLSLEHGSLKGEGTYRFDQTFAGELTSSGLTLSGIDLVRAHLPSLTGNLSLNVKAKGKLEAPHVLGELSLAGVRYEEMALGKGSLRLEGKDQWLQIHGTPVKGVEVSGRVQVAAGLPATVSFDLDRFSLRPLIYWGKKELLDQGMEGWIGGSGQVRGRLASPKSLEGEVRLKGGAIMVPWVDQKFSEINGEFSLEEGRIRIRSLTATDGEGTVSLQGNVGGEGGRFESVDLAFDLQRLSLRPLIYLGKKDLLDQGMRGWIGGRGTIRGSLEHLPGLEAETILSQVEVRMDGYHLTNRGAVGLSWQKEALILKEAAFRVGDADLVVSGTIPRSGKQVLRVVGDIPLPMLDPYLPAVQIVQGVARTDVELIHQSGALGFRGRVGIAGAEVAVPRVNQKFSEIKGEISLKENLIHIRSLTAQRGRGSISLQGKVGREGGQFTSLDLALQGKDWKWQYPEEFSTYTNFLLVLKGKPSQPSLVGRVDLARTKYVKNFDIKELLLRFQKEEDSAPFSFSDRLDVLLDVALSTQDKLVFQSNLADLGLKARLRLTGSLKKPVLLGRADLEDGALKYLDRKFVMNRGRVEFIDPHRLRPYFDFEAQSDVDKYRVKMLCYGTPQQFNLNFYSDPPLSQVDMISLLVVGKTSGGAKSGAASSLVANRISQKLTQGIQRITDLDALEIHTILEEGEGEKGVEVLTRKTLGEDLTFTYKSNTTANTNDQVLEMEYRLTDHISLVGTNNKGGSGGFDVKFSFSWE